jgi:arginyl-tRNA synthetase
MYPLIKAEKNIKKIFSVALKKLNYQSEIKLEKPPENMGDFAFPCFQLAPIAKKSPKDIAKEISKEIKEDDWIKKIETKGAYVNIFLNSKKINNETMKIILKKDKTYGNLDKKDKKIIIEHTSANPNGPLHVGRARNPIIGDTFVRIYKAAGYDVESQFYLDDMGKQVAILAWGVNNLKRSDIPKAEYDKADHKTVGFYQVASNKMKENKKISNEIAKLVKKSEDGHEKTIDLIHKAYKPVLKGILDSLKRINIKVDKFVPESDFVKNKSVDNIVKKLKASKHCGKEDGAYYLDMQPYGIKGRNTNFYFLRKDGTSLYATRDIAYHMWKAKNSDLLINILGEDHKLESRQVQIALELLEVKNIPKVVFYSFVSLPGGKMSTRKARVVYLDDLIDECVKRAYEEVKKRRGEELNKIQMQAIAEIIGIGAVRYNIIKVQPEKDIVFKWEEALNFEGNSSPFIQYSHARACSILNKNSEPYEEFNPDLLAHESEIRLIKKISELPLIINEAAEGFKPHIVSSFLFEVASLFNQFYRDCPVLPEKDEKLRRARIALVDATRITLKNGLNLLGIVAPKEM